MPSAFSSLTPTPATASGSYSSTLTIEELDAASGSVARSLLLQGGGLPLQGANWGVENALDTTWYPGNGDEGTQQILVPKELPSSWTGEWRRPMLGRTPATFTDETGTPSTIVDPYQLWLAFESIVRGGQRLRVTWAVDGSSSDKRGKVVREGRAKKLNVKVTRLQDIEWEVEWHWVGRGARTQKAAAVRDDSLVAAAAALNVAVTNLVSLANSPSFLSSNTLARLSASALTLGQLEALANAPFVAFKSLTRSLQRIATSVQRVADIATGVVTEPEAIAANAVDFARNAVGLVNTYVVQLSRTPTETLALKASVTDMLRAANYFGRTAESAQQIAANAQAIDAALRKKLFPPGLSGQTSPQSTSNATVNDVVAMYVTKDGDTPQRISQRFYRTPDHGVDILKANRLPWYQATFPRGQVLVIPALGGATRSA